MIRHKENKTKKRESLMRGMKIEEQMRLDVIDTLNNPEEEYTKDLG
jgi:hypothetical protein